MTYINGFVVAMGVLGVFGCGIIAAWLAGKGTRRDD
jgi:hypothetical protein